MSTSHSEVSGDSDLCQYQLEQGSAHDSCSLEGELTPATFLAAPGPNPLCHGGEQSRDQQSSTLGAHSHVDIKQLLACWHQVTTLLQEPMASGVPRIQLQFVCQAPGALLLASLGTCQRGLEQKPQ